MSLEEIYYDFAQDVPPLINKMKNLLLNQVKFINELNRIHDQTVETNLKQTIKSRTLQNTNQTNKDFKQIFFNTACLNKKQNDSTERLKSKFLNNRRGKCRKRFSTTNFSIIHKLDESQDQILIDDTQSIETFETSSNQSQNRNKLLKNNAVQTYVQLQNGIKFKAIREHQTGLNKEHVILQNNFIYSGQLFLNKFHGKGQLTLPQKQIIKAKWQQGKAMNPALIKYPQGQVYYGQMKKYHRHGYGHLFFNDGSKYQGDFVDGQLTGHGVFTDLMQVKTQGYWYYGQYLGQYQEQLSKKFKHKSVYKKNKNLNKNINIFTNSKANQLFSLIGGVK